MAHAGTCDRTAKGNKTGFKAAAPVSVMQGSMTTPATVAYIMQQKYQLGMPLTRQSKYLKEFGVEIGSSTLANWVIKSSRWFDKLWQRENARIAAERVCDPCR